MFRLLTAFLLSLLFTTSAFSEPITRVIYITFDGTRWQDVFVNRTHFPKLWQKYASELNFYGMPNSNTVMHVGSIPLSLPSYLSQTSGFIQPCFTNDCGRIKVETFLETITHKLNLNKRDVAVFASWPGIADAAESVLHTTFTNAGNLPVFDPDTSVADPVMRDINEQQLHDGAGDGDRYDRYTFAHALHYLEKYQPRFMWISFNDADANAHDNNIVAYHRTLDFYDNALDILFTTLKKYNLDKDTMIIITTDHGRGDGANWTSHGIHFPESLQTWAIVKNGILKPDLQIGNTFIYSTLSVRPTIESAMGV